MHRRSLELPVPIQDTGTFLKLLELDLAAHPPGAPVKKIGIAAQPAPPRFAQSELFVPRGPEPARLELTLARLRGLVGEDRVGSAELLDTHAPEAFRMCRFHPGAKDSRDVAPSPSSPTPRAPSDSRRRSMAPQRRLVDHANLDARGVGPGVESQRLLSHSGTNVPRPELGEVACGGGV